MNKKTSSLHVLPHRNRYVKTGQMCLYLRWQIRRRALTPADPGDFTVPQLKPSGYQLQAHAV